MWRCMCLQGAGAPTAEGTIGGIGWTAGAHCGREVQSIADQVVKFSTAFRAIGSCFVV
jgi:hypothetical protein